MRHKGQGAFRQTCQPSSIFKTSSHVCCEGRTQPAGALLELESHFLITHSCPPLYGRPRFPYTRCKAKVQCRVQRQHWTAAGHVERRKEGGERLTWCWALCPLRPFSRLVWPGPELGLRFNSCSLPSLGSERPPEPWAGAGSQLWVSPRAVAPPTERKREVKVLASELCLADTGSLPPPSAPWCFQPSRHVVPGMQDKEWPSGPGGPREGQGQPPGVHLFVWRQQQHLCDPSCLQASAFSGQFRVQYGVKGKLRCTPSPLLRWLSEEEGKTKTSDLLSSW